MASPFARAQKTIDIPFDPPNTVTIQQLNGRQIGKAQKAFFNELIAEVQGRGGAKVQKDIQTLFEKDKVAAEAEVEKVKSDPLNGFDKYALCYAGIKAWTYPESLEPVAIKELTADGRETMVMRIPAIDELRTEAVDFYATEIMRLTMPERFLTADEVAAERKNG